jgi:hypothetical protein
MYPQRINPNSSTNGAISVAFGQAITITLQDMEKILDLLL